MPSNCVFCENVAHREPARIVYEDDDVMVFWNRLGWVPVMLLAVPKEHLLQGELWTSEMIANVAKTAAEVGSTTIETVARPMELKETILEQQERARYNVAARQAAPFVAAAGGQGRATVLSAAGAVPDAARDDMRECPYCAETIKARAKVCRFCGRSL